MTFTALSTLSTSSGSRFADADAARLAVEMAQPCLQRCIQDPTICGSGFLYLVIMDPGLRPTEIHFDAAILLEQAVGDRRNWDADYAAFARAKARLSWHSGLDSSHMQNSRAHALSPDDTLLWGSVCLDGVVVGVSGAHPWYDEALALTVAANLRAIAKARHAAALSPSATDRPPPRRP